MSPLYPEPYASARQCIYEIEGAPGQSVALDFTDFALEGFSCDFDSITVRKLVNSSFRSAHFQVIIFSVDLRWTHES